MPGVRRRRNAKRDISNANVQLRYHQKDSAEGFYETKERPTAMLRIFSTVQKFQRNLVKTPMVKSKSMVQLQRRHKPLGVFRKDPLCTDDKEAYRIAYNTRYIASIRSKRKLKKSEDRVSPELELKTKPLKQEKSVVQTRQCNQKCGYRDESSVKHYTLADYTPPILDDDSRSESPQNPINSEKRLMEMFKKGSQNQSRSRLSSRQKVINLGSRRGSRASTSSSISKVKQKKTTSTTSDFINESSSKIPEQYPAGLQLLDDVKEEVKIPFKKKYGRKRTHSKTKPNDKKLEKEILKDEKPVKSAFMPNAFANIPVILDEPIIQRRKTRMKAQNSSEVKKLMMPKAKKTRLRRIKCKLRAINRLMPLKNMIELTLSLSGWDFKIISLGKNSPEMFSYSILNFLSYLTPLRILRRDRSVAQKSIRPPSSKPVSYKDVKPRATCESQWKLQKVVRSWKQKGLVNSIAHEGPALTVFPPRPKRSQIKRRLHKGGVVRNRRKNVRFEPKAKSRTFLPHERPCETRRASNSGCRKKRNIIKLPESLSDPELLSTSIFDAELRKRSKDELTKIMLKDVACVKDTVRWKILVHETADPFFEKIQNERKQVQMEHYFRQVFNNSAPLSFELRIFGKVIGNDRMIHAPELPIKAERKFRTMIFKAPMLNPPGFMERHYEAQKEREKRRANLEPSKLLPMYEDDEECYHFDALQYEKRSRATKVKVLSYFSS